MFSENPLRMSMRPAILRAGNHLEWKSSPGISLLGLLLCISYLSMPCVSPNFLLNEHFIWWNFHFRLLSDVINKSAQWCRIVSLIIIFKWKEEKTIVNEMNVMKYHKSFVILYLALVEKLAFNMVSGFRDTLWSRTTDFSLGFFFVFHLIIEF